MRPDRISLFFLLSPLPSGPVMALPVRLRRFVCHNQIRIAVACREMRSELSLELTLRVARISRTRQIAVERRRFKAFEGNTALHAHSVTDRSFAVAGARLRR